MTGTNLYVKKCKQSRSYLNHLVYNFSQTKLFICLSIMLIATCFDSKESSPSYSMNHNIDTSSDCTFWDPKTFT